MTHQERRSAVARPLITVLLVALVALGCSNPTRTEERAAGPTSIPAPAGVATDGEPLALEVLDGGDVTGLIITDVEGMAVYGTTGETVDNFVCTGDCFDVWIPVESDATAIAEELDPALFGSVLRPGGITQLTYAGVPLYRWSGDKEVGITGGAGIAGTWFALSEAAGFVTTE